MDDTDYGPFRDALVKKRRQLIDVRQHNLDDEDELIAGREPDINDEAADSVMAGIADRLSEAELTELKAIQAALERMDAGEYGICLSCSKQIAQKRLEALPWASMCIECAEESERIARTRAS